MSMVMQLFVETELLDVMITFKRYCKGAEAIPFVFDKEDPRIDWTRQNDTTSFYLYGNYSIMEIRSSDGEWTTALIKERQFKLKIYPTSYIKGFYSTTPVMCFLNEEDAKRAEEEYVLIDRGTYRLLREQGLIRMKNLPKKYQAYVYD